MTQTVFGRDRGPPGSCASPGGLLESELGPLLTATYHPSAVLRAPRERRAEVFGALVEDLGAGVRAAV